MSILEAIFVEAFCTIHMTVFVLLPISKMLDPDKNKNLFKKLFIGRIIFLLFYDIFIGTYIAMVDFFMIFLGAFIIVPIFFSNTQKENKENIYSNVLIDEEIKSGYDGSYLFLLEKMKQYFELDEFLLSELDSFLNKNKQNTIFIFNFLSSEFLFLCYTFRRLRLRINPVHLLQRPPFSGRILSPDYGFVTA